LSWRRTRTSRATEVTAGVEMHSPRPAAGGCVRLMVQPTSCAPSSCANLSCPDPLLWSHRPRVTSDPDRRVFPDIGPAAPQPNRAGDGQAELGLLANLVCRNDRDPVAVAEARRPFHLVPALGQNGDDLADDVLLARPQHDNITGSEGRVGRCGCAHGRAGAGASATTCMTRRPNFRSARCIKSSFSQRDTPGGNVQITRVS
jgi:hypothetical protein